jgi:hypothetical protein
MAMSLSVTIIRNDIPSLPAKARGGAQRGVNMAAQRIVTTAQSRARVRTGFMRDNTVVEAAANLQATAHARAPYSGFLDQGTRSIAADHWFSGAVDQERTRLPDDLREIIGPELV